MQLNLSTFKRAVFLFQQFKNSVETVYTQLFQTELDFPRT